MAVVLGNNIASLGALRQIGKSTAELSSISNRLSSGLRINKAGDDAAGLAIAASLNVDGRVDGQAIRNINDGISVTNVLESTLSELKQIVTRQLELATQAANGSYSLEQRNALDKEARALTEEYNRLVASTTFNGMSLLSGSTAVNLDGIRI